MKKLLSVSLGIILFLSGCTVAPEEVKINKSFSLRAEIEFNSAAFTVDFISDESGCSAVFLSPENIKGFRIGFNGIEFEYSYGDISFSSGAKKEAENFLELFYFALRNPAAVITKNESGYTVEGTVKGYPYYLNINKEQLTPTYFEVEQQNLTVRFL